MQLRLEGVLLSLYTLLLLCALMEWNGMGDLSRPKLHRQFIGTMQ